MNILEKKEQIDQAIFMADLMGYDVEKYKQGLEKLDELSEKDLESYEDLLNFYQENNEIISNLNETMENIEDSIETAKWVLGGIAVVGLGIIAFTSSRDIFDREVDRFVSKKFAQLNKKLNVIQKEIKKISIDIKEMKQDMKETKADVKDIKKEAIRDTIKEVQIICDNIISYTSAIETDRLKITDIKIDELLNRGVNELEKQYNAFLDESEIRVNLLLMSNLYISLISFMEVVLIKRIQNKNFTHNNWEKRIKEISQYLLSNDFLDALRRELVLKEILDNRQLDIIENYFFIKSNNLFNAFIENKKKLEKKFMINYSLS